MTAEERLATYREENAELKSILKDKEQLVEAINYLKEENERWAGRLIFSFSGIAKNMTNFENYWRALRIPQLN